MPGPEAERPRIFWYDLASKWAIRAAPLADPIRANMFLAALRQTCGAVFHHGAKAWLVPESRLGTAKQLVKKYYLSYQLIGRPETQKAPPLAPPPLQIGPYEIFCALVEWSGKGLLSSARAKTLYRKAAARLHPDHGGSADKMAALNGAWRAIRDTLA